MRKVILAVAALVGLSLLPSSFAEAAPAPVQSAPDLTPPGLFYPPNLTAEQWAAKFPATAAAAAQLRAKGIGPVSPAGAKFDLAVATGPEPWGGVFWVGGDDLSAPAVGCSSGINSMTPTGTRYVTDAGHCFVLDGNTGNRMSPTTGKFAVWADGSPIGNTGFGNANFNNTYGDNGWIRANQAGLTFSEVAVYDSRGAVNVVCACDPVVGTTGISISAGHAARLMRNGVITQVNKVSNFGGVVNAVPNQAEVRFPWTPGSCVISGDSGSPVIGPNHEFYGTVSGGLVSGGWCFVAFDQSRKSMQRVGQVLAPSDPSTT